MPKNAPAVEPEKVAEKPVAEKPKETEVKKVVKAPFGDSKK